MTEAPDAMRFGLSGGDVDRRKAFRAAGRHSNRVRLMKRMIVVFCFAAVFVLMAISYFDPFGRLPRNFSFGPTTLNGGRITMENPRLNGYREDGRPYDLRAAYGVQDVRTPSIVELSDIEAKFDTSEQSAVHLSAPRGVYDSARDLMVLSGDIRITSANGFDIRLREAKVNFKEGTVVSEQPLKVAMPSGAIAANRLLISDNGKKISFLDGVETIIKPAEAPGGEENP